MVQDSFLLQFSPTIFQELCVNFSYVQSAVAVCDLWLCVVCNCVLSVVVCDL